MPGRSLRAATAVALATASLGLAAGVGAASAAAAIYVDKTNPACSDVAPGGGTAALPYCSILKGTGSLQPGQTLYIGNGTYAETVKPPSGTSTLPVVVTNAPGTTPVIAGSGLVNGVYIASKSYLTVSGLTVTGTTGDGVYVTGASNVTLSGMHVSSSGRPVDPTTIAKGMKIIGTTASVVSGNTVDHNTDSGIYLAQGTSGVTVSGNTTFANARGYTRAAPGIDLRSGPNSVVGNVSHDNEDSGIQLYTGSDGSLVADNVTYRNGDHGIDDYQATGERIVGNSVYGNLTAGINVEGGSTGATVENNLSVDNALASPRGLGNIRVDPTAQTGTVVNRNVVFLHASGAEYVWGTANFATQAAFTTSTGQEAQGKELDPRWANADSADFRLTAGSPAIDSADSAVSGEQPTDIAGTARFDDPAVANTGSGARAYDDRGAYEAPAGTTDAAPSAALSLTPSSGVAGVTVTANASASTDTDSTPVASYSFDFGDGSTAGPQAGPGASHQYPTPGTYTVSVSVTDTAGLTTKTAKQVVVAAAGNLVGNATFEANLTGWVGSGCDLTRVAGGHNEGWAANLANNGAGPTSCTLNDSPNWVLKTVAGTYTTTAWVRADTPGIPIKLRIREYAANGAPLGSVMLNGMSTGDWQQLSIPYTVAGPGSTLDLNIYSLNQPVGTNLQIDDVTESVG